MKTKHLFFATALVASFASCTNDDIVEMQQAANAERPTVDNVQLNFVADGVDSRLAFGSNGYAWEADDVIGALNMDTPKGDGTSAYWNKYQLVDYVNTSYPFTYDAEAKTWGTIGKMLEGNYFFAFPWSDFDGERTPKYSLTAQQQNGVKGAAVAESYADNQVFVGYSPILKGTGFDILTDIEMTPLLGAVQLRIKNAGEKTYHINKIIVKGTKVSSSLTINPIQDAGTTDDFSVADYLGKDFKGLTATVKADDEDFAEKRVAALRAIVDSDASNEFVQLFVNGSEDERAVAPGKTAYALIMVNPLDIYKYDADKEEFETGKVEGATTLNAEIYTDEGMIKIEDLLAEKEYNDYEVEGYVKSTQPGVANTVVVSFDDEAVDELNNLSIYTEEDLLQLINWNINKTKKTTLEATLEGDVELTKEALDLLKSNDKLTLKVLGSKTLTLAADLPADVLEYDGLVLATTTTIEDKTVGATVEIAGSINLTTNTNAQTVKFVVLEDAEVNINVLNAIVPEGLTIAEGGKLNVGTAAKVNNKVAIVNNGVATVDGLIQGAFTNNGILNLNGTAANVANEGVINMGATSKLLKGTNTNANNKDAVINTVSGATLSYINSSSSQVGRIKYVDGAIITYAGTGTSRATTVYGEVYVEVGGADVKIATDTYKEKGVNLWVLTDDVEITAGVTLNEIEIAENADVTLTVKTDSLLTITTDLTIKKNASLLTVGNVTANGVYVEEDAEWTNNGTATVVTTLENKGSVNNNGVAQAGSEKRTTLTGVEYKEGTEVTPNTGKGTWLQNPFVQKSIDDKALLLQEVIKEYVAYNAAGMNLTTINQHLTAWQSQTVAVGGNFYNSALYGKTYKTEEGSLIPVTEAEYKAAVAAVATAQAADLKSFLLAEGTEIDASKINLVSNVDNSAFFYVATDNGTTSTADDKTAVTNAYDVFRANVIGAVNTWGTVSGKTLSALIKFGAAGLSDTDVAAIIAVKCKFSFIYDGCGMEGLMQVWLDYSDALNTAGLIKKNYAGLYKSGTVGTETRKLAGEICDWALAVLSSTTTDNEILTAAVTAVKAAGYTTVTSYKNFNGFSDAQVNAIWRDAKGLVQTGYLVKTVSTSLSLTAAE